VLFCVVLQVKGLLEIVSAASEFDTLPLRPGEENVVEKMINHAPVAVDKPKYSDPHTKVNALLQAHFSRERLSGDLGNDARTAVRESARLLQVCLRIQCLMGLAVFLCPLRHLVLTTFGFVGCTHQASKHACQSAGQFANQVDLHNAAISYLTRDTFHLNKQSSNCAVSMTP
jgi:hypothetical protein